MKRQIVLGMGAGQCGLEQLAQILGRQQSAHVSLHQPPLLPWEHHPGRPGIEGRIARWKSMFREGLIGDVAPFYLPYVEAAIESEPGLRIICLRRPQDEFVAAFIDFLQQNYPLPINHWTTDLTSGWHHDPLWTQTFPQYETSSRTEGLSRYWQEYYEKAEQFADEYPNNVLLIDFDQLISEQGVRRLLDFVGIDRARQVPIMARPLPVVPMAAQADVPTPRFADPLDPRRCVVLVPFAGSIDPECDNALKELERRGYQVRRVGGYAAIDQARNQIATDALVDHFEETLWIDSDIGFHPDAVETLRRHPHSIVCAIYPQKGKRTFACEFPPDTQSVTFGQGGGITELVYAGTGFLLVRRQAYSAVQRNLRLPICNDRYGRPMIPFFAPLIRPIDDGHWYLAEDYSFCERVRQCGFKVFGDTSIRLWHIGRYRYGWEDAGMDRPRLESFTLKAAQKPE